LFVYLGICATSVPLQYMYGDFNQAFTCGVPAMSLEQTAFPDAFDEYPVGEGRSPRDAAW
jgi:hypothetical protein